MFIRDSVVEKALWPSPRVGHVVAAEQLAVVPGNSEKIVSSSVGMPWITALER